MKTKEGIDMKMKKLITLTLAATMAIGTVGCTTDALENNSESVSEVQVTTEAVQTEVQSTSVSIESNDYFTERDLEQEVDLSEASYIELKSETETLIDSEGTYVFSGDVTDTMIKVDVDDESKVQIVLDGVTIVNESTPAIYVLSGDKIFVTTTDSVNSLTVEGNFTSDGDTNTDAVIFSKSDLVLNGTGSLEIISLNGNGVTSKDDLKITGGTIDVQAKLDGFEANDSIRIAGGTISVVTDKDAFHSENDEDLEKGYIYIQGGTLNISAKDDAIRANTFVQVDGGTINIETCTEGLEATQVIINDGTIDIYSTDDGINATRKSNLDVEIVVNGGDITVDMASGDTDAFDANGDLYINGGNITVDAQSVFDADGTAEMTGGTVVANGEVMTEIVSSGPGGNRGPKRK